MLADPVCCPFSLMKCGQHFDVVGIIFKSNVDSIFFFVVRIIIQISKCCVHFLVKCGQHFWVVRIFKKLSASDIWKKMLSAFSFDEIRTTF